MVARLHRAEEVLQQVCASAVRNGRRVVLGGDSGFTLIEMLISMTVLLIVSSPLAMVMTTSVVTHKYNKQRTLAQQAVMQKVEVIRSLPYDQVGTASGNPNGTVSTPDALSSSDTKLNATMTTQITYVSDATPAGFVSEANYKKVVITVTRNGDSKQLAKEVTYVSPPGDGSYAASGNGIIGATLIDFTNAVKPGIRVDLTGGPSGPRSDISDAGGKVGFPALTVTPSSGSQAYYDLTIPSSSGYATLDLPPSTTVHTALTASQKITPTIRVFKPSTVSVTLVNAFTLAPVSNVQVNLAGGPSPSASATSDATGKVSFPGLAPNSGSYAGTFYDVTVPASTGWTTLAGFAPPNAVAHTALAENQTWSTTIKVYRPGTITATLVDATTGAAVSGIGLNLTGGPSAPLSGTSDGAGKVTFSPLLPTTSTLYDLAVSTSAWTTLPADVAPNAPARTAIAENQTWATTLHIYKAGVISVTLKSGSSTYVGAATITIISPRGSATYAITNGLLTVTTFAGEPLMPNQTYTVGAQVGTNTFAPAVVSVVPASGYPGTTTQAFTLTRNTTAQTMRTLNVTVKNAANVLQSNARVDLTGGPSGLGIVLTATTDASGLATFSVPNNTTSNYVARAYTATAPSGVATPAFAVTASPTAKTITVP